MSASETSHIILPRVPEDLFREWIHVRDRRYPGTVLIDPKTPLTFEGAYRFAAALAGAVERAENEPDPAEVEAVAEAACSALVPQCGLSEGTALLAEQVARAILARYTLTERKPGGGHG